MRNSLKSKEGKKNGGNCCYWNINIHNYNIDYGCYNAD